MGLNGRVQRLEDRAEGALADLVQRTPLPSRETFYQLGDKCLGDSEKLPLGERIVFLRGREEAEDLKFKTGQCYCLYPRTISKVHWQTMVLEVCATCGVHPSDLKQGCPHKGTPLFPRLADLTQRGIERLVELGRRASDLDEPEIQAYEQLLEKAGYDEERRAEIEADAKRVREYMRQFEDVKDGPETGA